jgi:hypothetical protein
MSIIHSGAEVVFDDREWSGAYKLEPYPIFDAAKRFTSGYVHSRIYDVFVISYKEVTYL